MNLSEPVSEMQEAIEVDDSPIEATRDPNGPQVLSSGRRQASRLPWNDLHDDEKVERLRGVVRDQQRILNRLSEYIDQMVDHEHFEGHIVKRILSPGCESGYGFKQAVRNRPDEWL